MLGPVQRAQLSSSHQNQKKEKKNRPHTLCSCAVLPESLDFGFGKKKTTSVRCSCNETKATTQAGFGPHRVYFGPPFLSCDGLRKWRCIIFFLLFSLCFEKNSYLNPLKLKLIFGPSRSARRTRGSEFTHLGATNLGSEVVTRV